MLCSRHLFPGVRPCTHWMTWGARAAPMWTGSQIDWEPRLHRRARQVCAPVPGARGLAAHSGEKAQREPAGVPFRRAPLPPADPALSRELPPEGQSIARAVAQPGAHGLAGAPTALCLSSSFQTTSQPRQPDEVTSGLQLLPSNSCPIPGRKEVSSWCQLLRESKNVRSTPHIVFFFLS